MRKSLIRDGRNLFTSPGTKKGQLLQKKAWCRMTHTVFKAVAIPKDKLNNRPCLVHETVIHSLSFMKNTNVFKYMKA